MGVARTKPIMISPGIARFRCTIALSQGFSRSLCYEGVRVCRGEFIRLYNDFLYGNRSENPTSYYPTKLKSTAANFPEFTLNF
jgi:hypothetical protein